MDITSKSDPFVVVQALDMDARGLESWTTVGGAFVGSFPYLFCNPIAARKNGDSERS
jgi:hypothetical protein